MSEWRPRQIRGKSQWDPSSAGCGPANISMGGLGSGFTVGEVWFKGGDPAPSITLAKPAFAPIGGIMAVYAAANALILKRPKAGWHEIAFTDAISSFGLWRVIDGTEPANITFDINPGIGSVYVHVGAVLFVTSKRKGVPTAGTWPQGTGSIIPGGTQVAFGARAGLATDAILYIASSEYTSGLAVMDLGYDVNTQVTWNWDAAVTPLVHGGVYSEHVISDVDPRLQSGSWAFYLGAQPIVGGNEAATTDQGLFALTPGGNRASIAGSRSLATALCGV